VYYLSYALQKGAFEAPDLLWSTLAFIVLVSILLHGATVTPVMRYLDWRQTRGHMQRETAALAQQAQR
jgi:NhaP-type Na+/H+ or K+/H+ antiporter